MGRQVVYFLCIICWSCNLLHIVPNSQENSQIWSEEKFILALCFVLLLFRLVFGMPFYSTENLVSYLKKKRKKKKIIELFLSMWIKKLIVDLKCVRPNKIEQRRVSSFTKNLIIKNLGQDQLQKTMAAHLIQIHVGWQVYVKKPIFLQNLADTNPWLNEALIIIRF